MSPLSVIPSGLPVPGQHPCLKGTVCPRTLPVRRKHPNAVDVAAVRDTQSVRTPASRRPNALLEDPASPLPLHGARIQSP
jgi:hypothetical protein